MIRFTLTSLALAGLLVPAASAQFVASPNPQYAQARNGNGSGNRNGGKQSGGTCDNTGPKGQQGKGTPQRGRK
jgi:hypothetical protein